MAIDPTSISRAVSHALRDEPWVYELELDAEGWAGLAPPLSALRQKGGERSPPRRERVEEMISASPWGVEPLELLRPVGCKHLLRALLVLCVMGTPSVAAARENVRAPPADCSMRGAPEADDVVRAVRQSQRHTAEFSLISVYVYARSNKPISVLVPVLPSAAASAVEWEPVFVHLRNGLSVYILASYEDPAELIVLVAPKNALPVATTAPLSSVADGTLNLTLPLPSSPWNRDPMLQVCADVVSPSYEPKTYAPRAPHGRSVPGRP